MPIEHHGVRGGRVPIDAVGIDVPAFAGVDATKPVRCAPGGPAATGEGLADGPVPSTHAGPRAAIESVGRSAARCRK